MHSPLSAQGFSLSAEQRRSAHLAPALEKLPAAPSHLSVEAKKHWAEVGGALVFAGVLTHASLGVFEEMCILRGDMVALWVARKPVPSGWLSRMREYRRDLRILDMLHGYPMGAGGEAPPVVGGPIERSEFDGHKNKRGVRRRREQEAASQAAGATPAAITGANRFSRFASGGPTT